jgi:cytochrome c-type biogenesis protein
VALAAGAVTFLSPCVLPLVPGYLSYVTGMSGSTVADAAPATTGAVVATDDGSVATVTRVAPAPAPTRGRTVAGASLFVLGFSVLFASEGVLLGGIGVKLLSHARAVDQVLGVATIVLGLLFAGAFDWFLLAGRIARPSWRPRAGLAGAPLLGLMFGLTWTPCVGPTLGVVLGLAGTSGTASRGALLAFTYGIGIGIPFLIVAFAFQRGMNVFGFARRHARLITAVGGAMLVVVGVLEVTGTWQTAMSWLQVHWTSSYNSPI